jgi:hypothetical protein
MRFADLFATRARRAIAAGLIAFIVAFVASRGRATAYDNYVLLAQAFAHGRVWIDWPGAWIDALPYLGRYYVIEAPLPAVLLLPWVALTGSANQTLLAVGLCGLAVGLCWLTCERLGLARAPAGWICAFLFAGTDLWWAAMLGDVWFIAHVAAVAATFVALAELTGPRRGWLVAAGAVAAVFSRFALVLAIPVYVWLLVREREPAQRRRALTGFAAVCGAAAIAWVAYNIARWGVWYDIGYTAWYHQDAVGSPEGSPFALRFLPMQLASFFVQGPRFGSVFPFAIPDLGGLALTWTSPALVLAFFARGPRPFIAAMWAAALLVAGPSFIYYVNGFAQFGMRHALDFEPFLVVLMALAVPQRVPLLARALIGWSCAAGAWGVWFWDVFYRR